MLKPKDERAAARNHVADGKRAVPNQVRNDGPLFLAKLPNKIPPNYRIE